MTAAEQVACDKLVDAVIQRAKRKIQTVTALWNCEAEFGEQSEFCGEWADADSEATIELEIAVNDLDEYMTGLGFVWAGEGFGYVGPE